MYTNFYGFIIQEKLKNKPNFWLHMHSLEKVNDWGKLRPTEIKRSHNNKQNNRATCCKFPCQQSPSDKCPLCSTKKHHIKSCHSHCPVYIYCKLSG